jgi:DNA-binding transcriptional regulator GbsR (MarR family)
MSALSAVAEKFVVHWGEMGARWGINRTVAQIHALLYVSPEPLNAEQIAETLSVARSNVSTSLKELHGWGLVKVTHVLGDRRDYFETLHDVWEMYQIILDQRKKREIDPTIDLLRECVTAAEKAGRGEAHAHRRLRELLDFFETMSRWYTDIRRMPTGAVIKFVRLGGKVRRLLGLAS